MHITQNATRLGREYLEITEKNQPLFYRNENACVEHGSRERHDRVKASSTPTTKPPTPPHHLDTMHTIDSSSDILLSGSLLLSGVLRKLRYISSTKCRTTLASNCLDL
jgi:hypothetical protein